MMARRRTLGLTSPREAWEFAPYQLGDRAHDQVDLRADRVVRPKPPAKSQSTAHEHLKILNQLSERTLVRQPVHCRARCATDWSGPKSQSRSEDPAHRMMRAHSE